jgi:hypothetical protein
MTPIVRNIQNNDAYEYLGGNKFRNLRTSVEGEVSDEKAQEILKLNLDATQLINDFPIIKTMINKLNLKFDK